MSAASSSGWPIKRIRFGAERDVAVHALGAPEDCRPLRVVFCAAVRDLEPDPPYATVAMEWFTDAAHVERFAAWCGEPCAGTHELLAVEHVLRGAGWLAGRWAAGGTRLKHMAVARRADGIGREEFAREWAGHAGTLGGRRIPAAVRGLAYVQNHPLLGTEWCYDAVNEAWFEDPEGLRARSAWLRSALGAGPGRDREGQLFKEHRFLAVEEEVLVPADH